MLTHNRLQACGRACHCNPKPVTVTAALAQRTGCQSQPCADLSLQSLRSHPPPPAQLHMFVSCVVRCLMLSCRVFTKLQKQSQCFECKNTKASKCFDMRPRSWTSVTLPEPVCSAVAKMACPCLPLASTAASPHKAEILLSRVTHAHVAYRLGSFKSRAASSVSAE